MLPAARNASITDGQIKIGLLWVVGLYKVNFESVKLSYGKNKVFFRFVLSRIARVFGIFVRGCVAALLSRVLVFFFCLFLDKLICIMRR